MPNGEPMPDTGGSSRRPGRRAAPLDRLARRPGTNGRRRRYLSGPHVPRPVDRRPGPVRVRRHPHDRHAERRPRIAGTRHIRCRPRGPAVGRVNTEAHRPRGVHLPVNRHRPPLPDLRARRVAVITPSALGDVIHTLPVLGALRQKFPDAHIAWIVNRAYQPLLDGHPCLDESVAFDRGALNGGWKRAAGASLAFARDLRKRRFDLVIDLQGLARSGLMTLATGATRRVGLSTAREGAALAYTDVVPVPDPDGMHAVEHNWCAAEALGVGHVSKRFDIPVRPESRAWANSQLRELPRPWMAFGVGARWLTKRWPPGHFARLAQMAQERFGGIALFTGAPAGAPLAKEVIGQLRGPWRDFVGTTSLQQLAGLL